ncbi:MAG: hypothetical protein OSJ62_17300 [Lachnospiraceae bacterium]|nr:hypothetical protein [Lachnospiraceae bacterium]
MKKYRGLILAVVLIGLGLGYYAYLSNRNIATPAETQASLSDTEKLIAKDIEKNYPNTPIKVVELYSDFTLAFYAKDTDEDTLEKLVKQSILLFDEELLAENSEEDLIKKTKEEVEEYHNKSQTITRYILEDSRDVDYYTLDDFSYCVVTVEYFIRNDSGGLAKTYEDFMLRKDEFDRWKIVGWQLTSES